jgi:TM2 domain-containing membrane protein YozV
MIQRILYGLLFVFICQAVHSQNTDTLIVNDTLGRIGVISNAVDTTSKIVTDTARDKRGHTPRGATLRSLILPGLGQIYNGRIWKVPIVYAGIGIPLYLFFDNKNWYNRTRYAIRMVTDSITDPALLGKVHPQLNVFVERGPASLGSLLNLRNSFRRDMDYSLLITLLMWGLNIVDATVDAHLRDFDVSDELSMKIKPFIMPGTMVPGVSLVLNFK